MTKEKTFGEVWGELTESQRVYLSKYIDRQKEAQQKEIEELKDTINQKNSDIDHLLKTRNSERIENTKLKEQLKECEKNLIDAVGH